MNDDDKIIICSGKSASLGLESAIIAAERAGNEPVVRELQKAKRLTDSAVDQVATG